MMKTIDKMKEEKEDKLDKKVEVLPDKKEKEKELPDVTEEPEKLVETWLKTVVMLEEVQDKDLLS